MGIKTTHTTVAQVTAQKRCQGPEAAMGYSRSTSIQDKVTVRNETVAV